MGKRAMIEKFRQTYISDNIWHFIAVGNNLAFESSFMKYKLKQYCNLDGLRLGHRPMIDLKHVLIIVNNGSFKGSEILGKGRTGQEHGVVVLQRQLSGYHGLHQ
jgi:hypothetical protein